jgi:hypothetical protein
MGWPSGRVPPCGERWCGNRREVVGRCPRNEGAPP